jgi:N utilization substance protein B
MPDKRHTKRIEIVQELYSLFFNPKTKLSEKTQLIIPYFQQLDILIEKSAPKYTISQIAKVDISILRLALYELLFEKVEPPKVIINEAVELAKDMGGEKSSGFINAVLGKIYEEQINKEKGSN